MHIDILTLPWKKRSLFQCSNLKWKIEMSVGLGLFLSISFCGLIYLYAQTKDRWNWGRFNKYMRYVIIFPIALGITIIGGVYLYEAYQHRLVVVTQIEDFKLGEYFQDVVFKHGNSIDRKEQAEFTSRWLSENRDKKGAPKYDQMSELFSALTSDQNGTTAGYYPYKNIILVVKNNLVEMVGYNCEAGDDKLSTQINGIGCGSSGDEIIGKFGNEVKVLCNMDKDNPRRVYDISAYGTRYYLEKNSVYRMAISIPAYLELLTGKTWVQCGNRK